MRVPSNVYLSFVLAGKTTNEVFEQWERDSKYRPRFGRNWWFWAPTLHSNGGRFRSYENTDINFHWLCLCISFTVYSWTEPKTKRKDTI